MQHIQICAYLNPTVPEAESCNRLVNSLCHRISSAFGTVYIHLCSCSLAIPFLISNSTIKMDGDIQIYLVLVALCHNLLEYVRLAFAIRAGAIIHGMSLCPEQLDHFFLNFTRLRGLFDQSTRSTRNLSVRIMSGMYINYHFLHLLSVTILSLL